jgi:hypothetical protein
MKDDIELQQIDEIQKALDGRMAGRLKPKAATPESSETELPTAEELEQPSADEMGDDGAPSEEMPSPLTPEEQMQLAELLQKMQG